MDQHSEDAVLVHVAIKGLAKWPLILDHLMLADNLIDNYTRPLWYERIYEYNSTSFLWRCFAIANRGIGTRNWSRYDMASANTFCPHVAYTQNTGSGSSIMITRRQSEAMRFVGTLIKDIDMVRRVSVSRLMRPHMVPMTLMY